MQQANTNENRFTIILVSLVATIGGFLFGFDSGVINGTIDGLQSAFNADDAGTGFNVASMLLGCAIGAFFAGKLADIFGRKSLLIVAAVFFIISALGSGLAGSSIEFVIYRVLGGVAVGAASVMSPAYIAEIAPARYRGALATIQQVAIITGLFSAFASNYALALSAGKSTGILWAEFEAWRWMFWVELAPASLFFFALFFIPESPRYLVFSGKEEKAKSVLSALFGEQQANLIYHEISDSLQADHKPSMRDIFDTSTKKVRPVVWVGIGLAVLQQLVGINVVFYYGAVLWQAVGFTESDALLINILSAGLSIFACIITITLIDKWGRKPILTVGSVGMATALALMVIAFQSGQFIEGQLQLPGHMGTLALVAANVYVFFFNLSWGPVMWVMLGEMFPNQVRGSGLAISGLAQWVANFLITITFPILLLAIGLVGAYSLYALAAFLSIFFVVKFVKETKGKSLEAM